VSSAYKKVIRGCGANIFKPFNKVASVKNRINKFHSSFVELDKCKNKEGSTGLIDKTEVPFLCM